MGEKSMVKVGPFGRPSRIWDEKGRSELVRIFISAGAKINSLQFQYFENGAFVLSNVYGKSTGNKFHVVKLNYPSEYLTGISGWRDDFGIRSITLHTNLGTHGPFGQHGSSGLKDFCFELGDDRQFGGFHGAEDSEITSIGAYINPITTLKANATPSGI